MEPAATPSDLWKKKKEREMARQQCVKQARPVVAAAPLLHTDQPAGSTQAQTSTHTRAPSRGRCLTSLARDGRGARVHRWRRPGVDPQRGGRVPCRRPSAARVGGWERLAAARAAGRAGSAPPLSPSVCSPHARRLPQAFE